MSRFQIYEEFDEDYFPWSREDGEDYQDNNNYMMKFLDGKKTIIAGIIMTTASFLVLQGIIDANTGVFISTITTIIFGSAAVVTKQMRDSGTL